MTHTLYIQYNAVSACSIEVLMRYYYSLHLHYYGKHSFTQRIEYLIQSC